MDPVSVAGLVAAAVAAVSSVAAARAARETVALTVRTRQEDQLRRLAEALTEVIMAASEYPRGDDGAAAGRYAPFDEAQRHLKRALTLSVVGLGAKFREPMVVLISDDAWRHPDITFEKARQALSNVNDDAEALAQAGERPWARLGLKRSGIS